jgi:hypothetical protein
MFIVREVMQCRPGKVRPLVQKFQAVSDVMAEMGLPRFRVATDVAGAAFWTLAAEIEVPSLDEFDRMQQRVMGDPRAQEAMAGYHDLVSSGRREIYRLEG